MERKQETQTAKPLYRTLSFREVDDEDRTVGLSFVSDTPVERWFGMEILDHNQSSIRTERMETGAPLLMDHDHRDVVGVVQSVDFSSGRGEAVVRFSKSARGEEIFQDVRDGIRSGVSVGYRVHKAVLEEQSDDGDTYRVTDWEPFEVSIVSVPADPSVGIGRNDSETNPLILERVAPPIQEPKEEIQMEPNKEAPEVDVREIQDQARKAERQRVREIMAAGEKTGNEDLARQFIENGKPADAFRIALVEQMGAEPVETPDPKIGMTEKETRQFSFVRAIHALSNPNSRQAQQAAAFELECSQAAQEREGVEGNGIRVPYDVLVASQRDLVVGTPTAGGNVVSTDLLAQSFIELLRNKTMVVQAGATVLDGLVGNIAIPRQTGGATAYWVNESGAPTESQQAIDQVAMTPKTVGAFTDFSRKLMLQSSIGVEAFVRSDLTRVIALEKDRVALAGSGTDPEPRGILNTTGIGDISGTPAAVAWANWVDLETEVAIDNADLGALAYFCNATIRGAAKKSIVDAGSGQYIWPVNASEVNGYPVMTTNQVPAQTLVFGNWNDLLIGEWGGLSLMVDPYTFSTSGTIRVVALHDCDIAVRHPESFATKTDITG